MKRIFRIMLFLLLGLAVAVLLLTYFSTARFAQFGGKASGKRLERMKESRVFTKGHFENPPSYGGEQMGSYWTMAKRTFFYDEERVPKSAIPVNKLTSASYATPSASGLRATWLGHATVLIEIGQFKILTDPVWGERASPSSIIGPQRFFAPPLALEELPKLDAVLISHDHYDHLDMSTIQWLSQNTAVKFFVPLGIGLHLEAWGVDPARITDLEWWQVARVGDGSLELTCTPAKHFSGRGFKKNPTLWSSWAIRDGVHSVYFSGDTGWFPGFAEIGAQLGPFDLTLIKIGAYDKLWPDIHVDPEQAVNAHLAVRGKVLLPIHWGTFNLAFHSWNEPAERLLKAAKSKEIVVTIPRPGQIIEPESLPDLATWWRDLRK